jgi:hypothetical protein
MAFHETDCSEVPRVPGGVEATGLGTGYPQWSRKAIFTKGSTDG